MAQEVPGPRVYQLYLSGDQAWLDDQIERTIASGYVRFCLTADTQVYSRREHDLMKGYVPMQARTATGTMLDPGGVNYQSTMSWDLVRFSRKFDIPLCEGVMNPEDAKRCVDVVLMWCMSRTMAVANLIIRWRVSMPCQVSLRRWMAEYP